MKMLAVSTGEILWDIIEGNEFLGGAPFNMCAQLARLGHTAIFVSAVGSDERGVRALQKASELGINSRFLHQTNAAPTGISCVLLDSEGRAEHQIPRPAAYDFVSLTPAQLAELTGEPPQWICYGTLVNVEPAPRRVLDALLDAAPKAKRFYDVNLRPRCWNVDLVGELMRRATGVKLNEDEAAGLRSAFGAPPGNLRTFAEAMATRFHLDLVCITRGPDGCALWNKGQYVEAPGFRVPVSDTVGAGDAFAASLLHGLSAKWSLDAVADFANRVGALVASRPGATPAWTESEARELKRN